MRTIFGFNLFQESLSTDPYFGPIVSDLATGQREGYVMHDGFLFKGNKLCIPDGSLHLKIIQERHNEGHVGCEKTLKLVADQFYCPSMRKEVAKFV
jgi:hypothetical protein